MNKSNRVIPKYILIFSPEKNKESKKIITVTNDKYEIIFFVEIFFILPTNSKCTEMHNTESRTLHYQMNVNRLGDCLNQALFLDRIIS